MNGALSYVSTSEGAHWLIILVLGLWGAIVLVNRSFTAETRLKEKVQEKDHARKLELWNLEHPKPQIDHSAAVVGSQKFDDPDYD